MKTTKTKVIKASSVPATTAPIVVSVMHTNPTGALSNVPQPCDGMVTKVAHSNAAKPTL